MRLMASAQPMFTETNRFRSINNYRLSVVLSYHLNFGLLNESIHYLSLIGKSTIRYFKGTRVLPQINVE